jgi:hypothetical protein
MEHTRNNVVGYIGSILLRLAELRRQCQCVTAGEQNMFHFSRRYLSPQPGSTSRSLLLAAVVNASVKRFAVFAVASQ